MALIADGYQITLSGLVGGRPWSNVFHFQLAGSTPPDPLEAGQIVATAWGTSVLDYTCTSTTLTSFSYVDLRTLDGDSGSAASDPPYSGGDSASGSSPQVSVLIHWAATGGRAYRNGRTYVPGVNEGAVSAGGDLAIENRTDFTVQSNVFISECNEADLILSILSRTSPSTGIMRTVTAGTCDARVATQRRRQRR